MKKNKIKLILTLSVLNLSTLTSAIAISCNKTSLNNSETHPNKEDDTTINNKGNEPKKEIEKPEDNELITFENYKAKNFNVYKTDENLRKELNEFKSDVDKAKIEYKPEAIRAIEHFYLKPYSASFDEHNYLSYLKISNLDKYDVKLNKITVSENDLNTTLFDIDIIEPIKKIKINKKMELKSSNDITKLIDEFTSSKDFDDYFDYDKKFKYRFSANEIFTKENFNKIFLGKKIRYFDYKFIKFNEISNDNNVSLKIGLYLQNKLLKELDVNSQSWTGSSYFSLSINQKVKKDLDWYVENGNESLELIDSVKKAPSMFLPSKIKLNEVFKIKQFDGYKIELIKDMDANGKEIYDDKKGTLAYKFKITKLSDNTVFYSKSHNMELLKLEGDPEDFDNFNDKYFTSTLNNFESNSSFKGLKQQVDQINGTNFTPRRSVFHTYIEPSKMTNANLKFFLAFRNPNTGLKTDRDVPENKNISSDKENKVNINALRKDWYFGFYDVKGTNPNDQGYMQDLTFKIGFINKNNPEIRYHSNLIKLSGLTNTIADKFYPMEDLSNITLENLEVNTEISKISANEFRNAFKNKKTEWESYKNYIKVLYSEHFFSYKKYKLDT
ncbi:hypothetical protein [Mycoplasmopsis alligatoris]|uniref:Lipoprotein n=1 Tax=Mycoplasmopsis alligatoris A21JP2 TaxID=747682 RepID=D4XWT7_9BACT|nr:hypothetical protein [Mycoplasmopsis alligatoris]EFF41359.1 hypothetical protein MALL_0340 [Mycoplasmopsis alligatoris A21JP2]